LLSIKQKAWAFKAIAETRHSLEALFKACLAQINGINCRMYKFSIILRKEF